MIILPEAFKTEIGVSGDYIQIGQSSDNPYDFIALTKSQAQELLDLLPSLIKELGDGKKGQ